MAKFISRRIQRKLLKLVLALIITALLLLAQKNGWIKSAGKSAQELQPGQYNVISFEDGDTITIDMNGKSERIRMIGVDTPETQDPRLPVQCFGKVASEFTKTLIGTSPVRLVSDPTNTNRDRYDRLLRYVYLPDGKLVNAEIIKQGYGFAYTLFPFEKLEEFRTFEKNARELGLGLWGTCDILQDGEKQTTNPV
jgi:endonuclease YncB( thermonuclease family)